MFYLPFVVLKSFPAQLADKLFPEVNALVIVGGIVVSIFADCFLVLSAAQRVYDRSKDLKAG
jgi:uncharacterized membrane protein